MRTRKSPSPWERGELGMLAAVAIAVGITLTASPALSQTPKPASYSFLDTVEVALAALAFGVGWMVWKVGMSADVSTWYAATSAGAGARLTAAGQWYVHVSVPIFQFLLCLRLQRGAACGAGGVMAWKRGRGEGGTRARRALMSTSMKRLAVSTRDSIPPGLRSIHSVFRTRFACVMG